MTTILLPNARDTKLNTITTTTAVPTLLPYRNPSLSVDERVDDLIQRMNLEEKAGQLFHNILVQGPNGTLLNTTAPTIREQHLTHFNLLGPITDVRATAEWYNALQKLAAETRLGIPITLSSDPRHAFTDAIGSQISANQFSQWPASIGLAALRDPERIRAFANIARQEYLAVGIRSALHPQIDVATEPRWARISGTMGEDAYLTAKLAGEYIKGFTGPSGFGKDSVTTVAKHFPGSGPVQNGEDSHFTYGKNATYPGHQFEHHLIPFKAAIAAGVRQIMPYYSRPTGTRFEEVAAGFNKGIVTDLLRHELGFNGIVVSDWGLLTDSIIAGQAMPARAWGAEHLSEVQRAEKILHAGTDQFGGEQRPDLVLALVHQGRISESRLDRSVRRLLREKFLLGLFDAPYVDVDAALRTVGNPAFTRLGFETQRASFTLLTNRHNLLPLRAHDPHRPRPHPRPLKLYTEGLNPARLTRRNLATLVPDPTSADLALLRLHAPYTPRPGGFEASYHAGSLAFNATEQARQSAIYAAVPTIVDLFVDRPAAVPEIAAQAHALLVNYGASDDAFLDVVFGEDGAAPCARLPFDLPRSDGAVRRSREDVPFDTADPVFRFGHGLRYEGEGGGDCNESNG